MPDSRRLIWKGAADSIVGEIAQYCEWDTELEARMTHKFVQPKEAQPETQEDDDDGFEAAFNAIDDDEEKENK